MSKSAVKHRTEGFGKIVPVTSLKKDILNLVTEVSEFDEQITITKDGEPAVVMVNAEVFEGLMETLEILSDKKAMTGIRRALKDIEEGRVVTMEEVFG
jgi:antitoxin YefM